MKSALLKIILLIVIVAVVLALLIGSCGNRNNNEPPVSPSPSAAPTPSAPGATAEPLPSADPVSSEPPEASETPEPTAAVSPAPTASVVTPSQPTPSQPTPSQPTPSLPEVPIEPSPSPAGQPVVSHGSTVPVSDRVEDEWFSDAAFLGNSLVDGFRLFSGLTTCDVFAATSMTVMGAGSLISQMNANQYGKVYILLGINEIGYEADYFKTQYSNMLDTIIAGQPDADIYIMGLSPVSEHKSSTDSTFTMDRVRLYNEKLLELASEKGCYYLDLCEALSDESGYLPASVTTDGVHFSASHYQVWLEYLRTHHA